MSSRARREHTRALRRRLIAEPVITVTLRLHGVRQLRHVRRLCGER